MPPNYLNRFPKTRPPLPRRIQQIYAEQYKSNREGGTRAASLAQRMERWLHRKVADDVRRGLRGDTLEIGAGTLNQLPYEPVSGNYDIIEPFEALYRNSSQLGRVRHVYPDIDQVPAEARYDRITAIAAFEHVCDLPRVVARTGQLLRPDGTLRISIPSEGTFFWWLGWRATTGLEFWLRHGLDYGRLMRHEHVNTAREIEQILRHFYGEVTCSVFGLNRAISLYRFYECKVPDLKRCADYIDRN